MMNLRCIVLGATVFALLVLVAVPVAGDDAAAAATADEPHDKTEVQPVTEDPIKRVHVLNPGEREYLSPNLIGVQNIAMTYLPLTMNFINIIDAFREIVDGVRYEILLNAVDTKEDDADIVCRLVILEKPWLRSEWGDKVRELQHSNCTSDADNLTDPLAKMRALSDKYETNALFNGGTRNELSADEMAQLESQIMTSKSEGARRTSSSTTSTSTTTSSTTTTTESSVLATVKDVVEDTDTVTPVTELITGHLDDVHGDDNDDELSTAEPKELSDDEKKWLDDIFSIGSLSFENSRQSEGQQHNAKNSHDNNDEENDTSAKSNYLKRTIQTDAEPEVEQLELEHIRSKRSSNYIVGGTSPIDDTEAKTRLQNSLNKLAAGEGPNYKIGKIYSSTTKVVSGTLTEIDCDLVDDDGKNVRCNVEIWSQPWMPNGQEIKIKCDGKELFTKRHSRSIENSEKKSHKKQTLHGHEKIEHLFKKFQLKYNKGYQNTMERQMRLRIFRQNLNTIEELNRNEMGSAKYGITEFADMTATEYKQRTGLWQRSADIPNKHMLAEIPDVELPKEFDWREKGAVSKVKNQGSCGSCWAFSVTGNIEGLHAVKTGQLEEYSEQELLDCDTTDSACNGGLPDNAYEAILKIGGLELESEYPYTARKEQCRFNAAKVHVKVKGAVDLPKNETAMAQWLITNGPISIGINANAMQFYRGGVSHPWGPLCARSNLDHGVLIVGYGVSDYPMFKKTLPYWIIKNSWGSKWGEQGYYRVYRGDNTCGVSEMASSAVLA